MNKVRLYSVLSREMLFTVAQFRRQQLFNYTLLLLIGKQIVTDSLVVKPDLLYSCAHSLSPCFQHGPDVQMPNNGKIKHNKLFS